MNSLLRILGAIVIIVSILIGLYIGVYIMFYGGIVQIINSINPLNGVGIATGICKIIFCELAGIIPIFGITVAGYIFGKTV